MNFKKKSLLVASSALLTVLVSATTATTATTIKRTNQTLNMTDTLAWNSLIPLNPIVKTGKLKNGFTYFIAKHNLPEKRVFIHLVNKVGSVQETDDQQGLAHFLEHMNFNGLKHFPKNSIIDYLQKYGVNFGADLNAHTTFEETIFKLKIPSDNPELLKNSLQIARDWAQDATLEDEEINKERGIIVEEIRGLRDADNRMREQYYAPIMNYSKFAARRPIGTEEVVMNAPTSVLKKFYKDWYRPDIEAIVIVGDIDKKQIEQEVIRLFSDMKMPNNPPVLEKYNLDLNQKNKFIVATDPEATKTSGEFIFKFKEIPFKTVGNYRYSIIRSGFNSMMANRMNDIKLMPNTPLNEITIKHDHLLGGVDIMDAYFSLKNEDFETGFKTIQRELMRFQQHGFTQSELNRYIVNQKKSYEKFYASRNTIKSDQIVKSVTDYFLEKGPGTDVANMYKMSVQLLPTLTVKDINDFFNMMVLDWKRDILITAPERSKQNIPDEATVDRWIKEVNNEKIAPYYDEELTMPLLKKQPTPGQLVSEKFDSKNEIREITLSNGAKVLLKKSNTKPGQIVMAATSPGGYSLASDDSYQSAIYSSSIVSASGVGQYTAAQLKKYLSGIRASIMPTLGEREEGFSGSADSAGLKNMFEMMYGYFTEPRLEADILNNVKASRIASIANTKEDPMSQFRNTISERLYNGNPRRAPQSKEQIESIDAQKALAAFKDRYADASDFTFILVGDLNEDAIRPLLEKYVASLPRLDRKEKPKEIDEKNIQKGIKETIYKGQENKTSVQLTYFCDSDFSLQEKASIKALNGILNYMLTERLREEESGVYGIAINASYPRESKGRFNLNIQFGSSVEKTPALIKSALEEIQKIKKEGPNKVHFDKYIIEQKRNQENVQRGNYTWLGLIESEAKGEMGLSEADQKEQLLNSVTLESVKKVANKYINDKKMHQFILMPDKK